MDERIDKLADQLSTLVEIVSKKVVTPAPVKAVEEICVTCSGPHACLNFGTLPSNTIPNSKCKMKAITGVAYEGPSIPTNPSPKKVVEREIEETTDKEQSNFQGSTTHIPPPVNPILIPEPDVPKIFLSRIFHTVEKNCSAMLLKKLPKKLGDPDKFLIPCNFPGMDVCHALADLGASINLMPLSIWKKLSLPELTPTRMTLELADQSITHPKGLAEDVYVKVGKTGRALIDVYGEEITLRVDNEAITFNLDQTTRYSSTNDVSINRIDIIDEVCDKYALELLEFSKSPGGNLTLTSEPLTSEFILEEIEAYLKDDSISPEIGSCDVIRRGKLLNNGPFQLPRLTKEMEIHHANFIEESSGIRVKDLPIHFDMLT
ncbi:reverse transcriptase domain-containing protein [Tanacetum coccineum]